MAMDVSNRDSAAPATVADTANLLSTLNALHDGEDSQEPITSEAPTLGARVISLIVILLPFAGLVAAIVLMWGYQFKWVHLWLLVAGYLLTGLGITIGYHRLFTHRSFKTNGVVRFILGVLGSMTVEGPIQRWVAIHRMHHQHSDDTHDPHSPHAYGSGFWGVIRGFFFAHFGWFFTPPVENMGRYVPDLQADPVVRFVDRMSLLWIGLGLLIPAGIAFAITGTWSGALLGFIWGGLVRVLLVHHVTWSINSVCHLWGSRPFRCQDESRNNAVFGYLGMGEGWHNAHHAFPTSARHGLRWWEFDLSYVLIRGMSWIGLARDVRVPMPDRVAAKKRKQKLPIS
jgi:stearoyl-CoA desaturase (delta-9 desaturase)